MRTIASGGSAVADLELSVVDGDITALDVEAIANAANNALWMGSATAGRLPARWVIHGAVMGHDLRTDAELVRRTTESCLRVAEELGARSLALPAFGTGVGGFPLGECAEIMVSAAHAFESTSLERVVFAVFGDEAARAFRAAL